MTMRDKCSESISVVLATGFKLIYDSGPMDCVLAYNPNWGEFEIPFNRCCGPINGSHKFYGLEPGDKLVCWRKMTANQAGGHTTTYGIKEYLTISEIKSAFAAEFASGRAR